MKRCKHFDDLVFIVAMAVAAAALISFIIFGVILGWP